MRCRYKEHAYYCGENYLDVQIFPEFARYKQGKRQTKFRPTSDVQKKLNDENRKKKIYRIVNTNYFKNGIRFDLTYDEDNLPPDFDSAEHEVMLFIRRVKNYVKNNNLPELKFLYVTGYGEKEDRLHHHIILNGDVPVNVLDELWGKGYTSVKPLKFDKFGAEGIVRYFIEHIEENEKRGLKTTYHRSRNLKNPKKEQHTGRLKSKHIRFMSTYTDTTNLERLYPDYKLVEMKPYHNEKNGWYYFTCRFYKPPNKQRKYKKE